MITLDGNTYSFAITFTGVLGELRYDSSNWDLLLHDGVTVGGHRFLNMTNADERYQAKSDELVGLEGFEPQQKGFLVRLGPADYRLRTFAVDPANLIVTNANGYNGNVTFGFAAEITSDHTWSGAQTYTTAIDAQGGVTGNVTGDVVGDVTGNLTGDSTGSHTGSVDVRGATLQLDDGQIHLAALNDDVGEYILARGVPYGAIMMWSGSADAIPNYWYLCNGENDTPDLTDRFIVGAGNQFATGDTGGGVSATPTITIDEGGAHSHEGTVGDHTLTLDEIPAHSHNNGICDNHGNIFNHGSLAAVPNSPAGVTNSHSGTVEGKTNSVGGGNPHTHDLALEAGGAHSHTAESTEIDTVPPYYALCFIMKGV